ncbi:ATP-grasp domain-containing protein [Clostridiisalibacter paucivorans]|uniref:ATP-grasp domain-containing protein n=1 Tax=Clostridiisalibacter paucivorans TaxID=408753 RepID=UPI000478F309|nr:ATP-grasp domain-containing protein [Clostridiisalibacter paucivorans]
MNIITFDPFRTIGINGVKYIKPENVFANIEDIKEADYILFPQYWQVNFLVYGLNKKIFPNINTFHLGHNKIEMTRALLATFPEHVPYTIISGKTGDSVNKLEEDMGYPCVAKEVKNSMGQGVFLINNRKELKTYVNNNDTLYIQEKLPIDRDLRVVYVGNKVIGAYWRIGREGVFHNNIAKGATFSFEDIPEEAIKLVDDVANKLGINHAGFDVVKVENKYYILEFNVLFGNEGLKQLDISVSDIIYKYIMSDFDPNNPRFPGFPRKLVS